MYMYINIYKYIYIYMYIYIYTNLNFFCLALPNLLFLEVFSKYVSCTNLSRKNRRRITISKESKEL